MKTPGVSLTAVDADAGPLAARGDPEKHVGRDQREQQRVDLAEGDRLADRLEGDREAEREAEGIPDGPALALDQRGGEPPGEHGRGDHGGDRRDHHDQGERQIRHRRHGQAGERRIGETVRRA
jgi:hypothetical protein